MRTVLLLCFTLMLGISSNAQTQIGDGAIIEKPKPKQALSVPTKSEQQTKQDQEAKEKAVKQEAAASATKPVVPGAPQNWLCPDYVSSIDQQITSTITILNHSNTTAQATLVLYNADGKRLAKIPVKLAPGEKTMFEQITDENGYAIKEVNGYLEVWSNTELVLSGWTKYANPAGQFSFRSMPWQRF